MSSTISQNPTAVGPSSIGMVHMGLANLNLRMAANQVSPHGWSVGVCVQTSDEGCYARQAQSTLLHESPPPSPFIYPISLSRERKDKEEIQVPQ